MIYKIIREQEYVLLRLLNGLGLQRYCLYGNNFIIHLFVSFNILFVYSSFNMKELSETCHLSLKYLRLRNNSKFWG